MLGVHMVTWRGCRGRDTSLYCTHTGGFDAIDLSCAEFGFVVGSCLTSVSQPLVMLGVCMAT